MITGVAEPVLEISTELGEGPVWDERSGSLLFVDITRGAIHRWRPTSGTLHTIEFGQPVGAVVPRLGGGLVVAARDGVFVCDDDGQARVCIAPIESERTDTLMNDAKCDRAGRLWAGTVHVDEHPGEGSLYRVDGSGDWRAVVSGTTVSNGLGWSPDGSTMYYVDSALGRVDKFRVDEVSGDISDRVPFVVVDASEGAVPDGLTVDSQGGVWVALWEGAVVQGYAPSGQLVAEVRLPVSQVTSCTFGGPELDILYITTAACGFDADRPAEPSAGSVFAWRAPARGTPTNRFAG